MRYQHSCMCLIACRLLLVQALRGVSMASLSTTSLRASSSSSIHHGDALNVESWKALMAGVKTKGQADLLLTDPPYCRLVRRRKLGDEREQSSKGRVRKLPNDPTTHRFEDMQHYTKFTKEWIALALQYGLKPRGDAIIWTNPLGRSPIAKVMLSHGYQLHGEFLWAKDSKKPNTAEVDDDDKEEPIVISDTSPSNETLLRLHESALIFRHSSRIQNTDGDASTDWLAPRSAITSTPVHEHPCFKPFSVIAPLVSYYSKPGDHVLDCFAGSGAVLKACARLGRDSMGMEITKDWAGRKVAVPLE